MVALVQKSSFELEKSHFPKIRSELANEWEVVPPDRYWSKLSHTIANFHLEFRIPPLGKKIEVQKISFELEKSKKMKIRSEVANEWKVVPPDGF